MGEIWYRYEDRLYSAGVDEFDNPLGPAQLRVVLNQFFVDRHTPKGVWLTMGLGDKRFVLHSARKKFAHPTKEDALRGFIARKERQASIYGARVDRAKRAIRQAEWLLASESPNLAPTAERALRNCLIEF